MNPPLRTKGRLKILLTTGTVGGVWTYSLELARALGEHQVSVALATMGHTLRPEQRAELDELRHIDVFESKFKLESEPDPWGDQERAGAWLLDIEARVRPDIIHLNGYTHGALPWRAPRLIVGHSCLLSRWRAVRGEEAPPDWNRYREAVTQGLRAADLLVAPTQAMLAALQTHYGPLPHTRIAPYGREAARFRPGAREPSIFTAGRLDDEAKNLSALTQVASGLEWPVCIAGEQAASGEGPDLPENVTLLGRLSPHDMADRLARTSIFALPARYAPFSLSALEAALAGCALVLGDIPSLREIWRDAALYVPPDDLDALRIALNRLIGDYPCRKILADRARLRAQELTLQRMAAAYLAAYGGLLAARASYPPTRNTRPEGVIDITSGLARLKAQTGPAAA